MQGTPRIEIELGDGAAVAEAVSGATGRDALAKAVADSVAGLLDGEALAEAVAATVAGALGREADDEAPPGTVLRCPYDFSVAEAGGTLEVYPLARLKREIPSKNEACRVINELVRILNGANATIASLLARLSVLEEQRGRERETSHGQKSERRTTLDGGGADGADTGDDAETDGGAGADADARAGDSAGADGAGDVADEVPPDADPGGDGDSRKRTKPQWRARNGKPRRREGSGSERRLGGALHVDALLRLAEERIREAFGDDGWERLPNGDYEVVKYVEMPVVVRFSYERARNLRTGEIIAASSAEEGKLRARSDASPDLLRQLVYERTVLGATVPRILRKWSSRGLSITKQSMYLWYIQYGLALARPLAHRWLVRILESGRAQTDETWVRVREDMARDGKLGSVMWLMRTSELSDLTQFVMVSYTESRSAKALADIVRGYALKLMCDGYAGYAALLELVADAIELVGCLQHARSYFVDVIQALKGQRRYKKMTDEQRAKLPANRILDLFENVFRAESRVGRDATPEERARNRAERVRPALDELMAAIREEAAKLAPTDKGYMRKACDYALKYEERFYAAVDDPEMPITNSASERVFAGMGIMRSNFKQIDSRMGAEAMSAWFSVLWTARENGADELAYLSYIIERLPAALKENGDWRWYERPCDLDPDELEGYGDLSYLDAFSPTSDGFREYERSFREMEVEKLTWIAELVAAGAHEEPRAIA